MALLAYGVLVRVPALDLPRPMKHRKPLPHFCNCELSCPECIQAFWIWCENYSARFERPKGKRRQEAARARGEIEQ